MTRAPFGSWKSPITADLIARGSLRLADVRLDGDALYWLEMRPAEGGRYVVVRQGKEGPKDITPAGFNVRTRVHEYGGGAFLVANGTLFFSNFDDQRLYRQDLNGGVPMPLTPEGKLRFADHVLDDRRKRLICVCEDHTGSGEAVNRLVAVPVQGGEPTVLASGKDFYSSPRLSPDGTQLAWLGWNHPNLPWDGTELWLATIAADGRLEAPARLTGGDGDAIFQPEWSPDGVLHFVSDRTGWWNLYAWGPGGASALVPMEAEFGLPQWVFGMSTYGFTPNSDIVFAYAVQGEWQLARLPRGKGKLFSVPTPYTEFSCLRVVGRTATFIGGSPSLAPAVVKLDLDTGQAAIARRALELAIEPESWSLPEAIAFPTAGGLTAHGFYYAPKNPAFTAPPGEKPPLLVICHGGPTGATSTGLDLDIQFWTSRGFGVLDVNYGGSTGYGTAYRQRLKGQWGVVDVDDCVNGARYLVERDDCDGQRTAIRGGSAGGYTTLAALAFRDFFKAGASYYGVSDIEALMRETHKFESRYDRFLIGPYPQSRAIYRERSPIHHTERLCCPLILFQGLEDKVVPPNQAEVMFEALKRKGIPVAYLPFAGEQHGFRRAENIKRSLEAELHFYSRIFGFKPADPIEPVHIENLSN